MEHSKKKENMNCVECDGLKMEIQKASNRAGNFHIIYTKGEDYTEVFIHADTLKELIDSHLNN
jgi:hypothetical protein